MRKKKDDAVRAGTEDTETAEAGEPKRSASTTGAKTTTLSGAGRLTPLDIQQIEFRRSFKGYDEREVDEFLDRLTEDFAAALDEVQRLRERAEGGLGAIVAGAPDLAIARQEAEDIVQRARDDAARIVKEAEGRATAVGGGAISPADRAAIGAFIDKERKFLTDVASLVQGHAETVKGMAASARDRVESPPSAPASEPKPTAKPARAPTPSATTPSASGRPGRSRADAPREATPPSATESMPKASSAQSPTTSSARAAAGPAATAATAPGEGHVKIPEVRPAGVGKGDPELAEGDPSLRELFWGDE